MSSVFLAIDMPFSLHSSGGASVDLLQTLMLDGGQASIPCYDPMSQIGAGGQVSLSGGSHCHLFVRQVIAIDVTLL